MSDLHVLSGSYVLDALDELERTTFERHLRTCTECAVEVVEFQEVAAFLGGRVALVPPDRFRGQVMAQVAVNRQLPVAEPVSTRQRPLIMAVAATAVVIAGVAGLLGVAWTQDRATENGRATASVLIDRENQIARVLATPGRAEVSGTAAGGSMRLLTANGTAVLVATDLPAAPTGKTYQVWLFDDKGVRSVDLLSVRDGFGQALVPGVRPGSSVAVSVEPAGGSNRPSTEPFLKLRVT
jgi:anti-sigma factor RsiW